MDDSTRVKLFQDSVFQFCQNVLAKNCETLFFQVLKSDLRIFNDRLCCVNMMILEISLDFHFLH